MTIIYHNPRCAKSRQGVTFLEAKKVDFTIVKYLEEKFTVPSLTELIEILDIKPIELVRKNEAVWKNNYKDKTLTEVALIEAMVANPKLIERPIVLHKNKAVVARPTEKIETIL